MAIENKDLSTIKKPNQVEMITKEQFQERLREITKCKRDIVYFAEHYYRVQSLDKGLHIIKLYDIQKEFLQHMVENNRVICCSGRQQGKSTIYCIYVLWLTCFFPDKRVMMLAQKESTALELLDRIKTGYEYLPAWLKPGCVSFNKKSIEFANRSAIHGFASSSDGVRGQSCNCLILDEFAFVPKNIADKLFTSVYPVVSSSKNGKVIIVSTPNGTNNLYYDIWSKANSKDGKNNLDGWRPFTMWWWQVPGHDEKWKQAQIAAIGEERFAQEFNNEFISSSQFKKLISDSIIEKFRMKLTEYKSKDLLQGKEMAIPSADGEKHYKFRMYYEFNKDHTYIASGDCAEGIGGDASVLYVWDITNTADIKMCMRFSNNNVSLIEFAYITIKLMKLYANPFLAIESNGLGVGYIEQLRKVYGYENLVRLNRDGGYGINSHMMIRSKACLWFSEMMTTQGFGFEIPDKELIEEMPTFIKKNTTKHDIFGAIGDNHDDHLMSMIWMTWLLNEENIEKYFVISDYFTSSLGKTLPRIIMPLSDYTIDEVRGIIQDPIYRDFINFKLLMEDKYKEMIAEERAKSLGSDVFDFTQKVQNMTTQDLNRLRNHINREQQESNIQNQHPNNTGGCMFTIGNDDWFDGGECW